MSLSPAQALRTPPARRSAPSSPSRLYNRVRGYFRQGSNPLDMAKLQGMCSHLLASREAQRELRARREQLVEWLHFHDRDGLARCLANEAANTAQHPRGARRMSALQRWAPQHNSEWSDDDDEDGGQRTERKGSVATARQTFSEVLGKLLNEETEEMELTKELGALDRKRPAASGSPFFSRRRSPVVRRRSLSPRPARAEAGELPIVQCDPATLARLLNSPNLMSRAPTNPRKLPPKRTVRAELLRNFRFRRLSSVELEDMQERLGNDTLPRTPVHRSNSF